MKNMTKEERLLRTRESVLLSPTKDFSRSFDTIRQGKEECQKTEKKKKAKFIVSVLSLEDGCEASRREAKGRCSS